MAIFQKIGTEGGYELIIPVKLIPDAINSSVNGYARKQRKLITSVVNNASLCSEVGPTFTPSTRINIGIPRGDQITERDLN